MLRKIKLIIFLLIVMLLPNVRAISPRVEYIDNVYSNRIVDGKSINGQLGYIYLNNRVAYCIDPMKIIGKEYEPYMNKLDDYYTKEQQRKIKLIIHYGYDTHKDNQYYYMATQELIWRINNDGEFYFTTSSNLNGERIDIEKYKNEILNNVKKHDTYPSFNQITISPKLYDKVILTDDNNMLDGYYYVGGNNIVTTEENKLQIIIENKNPETIKLSKTTSSGTISRTYIGDGQTLITSSIDDVQQISINVIPNGVSFYLNINFKEADNPIFDVVKFKIYNQNTSNYILDGKIFESNGLGYFESDFKLDPGTYEIVYVDVPRGYIPSKLPNIFTLDENTKVDVKYRYTVTSYLEIPNGLLKINRGLVKYDKSVYKLDNIEYEVYAATNIYDSKNQLLYKKDNIITTLVTINGYAEIKLPLGKYYIIEKDNNYGIKNSGKHNITFKYIDASTDIYIVNKDIITPLPTFTFNINTYKENVDTSYSEYEYFKYNLIALDDIYYFGDLVYKKDEIISRLKSNINGVIDKSITLIPGRYLLKENTVTDSYYKKDDVMIEYTDINNNNFNYTSYKKLKRGNLLVNIYSEIDDKPEYITFFYNENIKYKINDKLLIENIKVGNYKLFYDKEYTVNIKDNETTILEIKLLKNNKDDIKGDDNKDSKKEDDKNDIKEEDDNKDSKKEDDKNDIKGNDDKDSKKEDNKKDEKNEDTKVDNKKDIDNSQIENIKLDENKEQKNESNNFYDTEKLPNTYNYLKKYCTLYEIFIIAGLMIKLYAKKNK